MSDYLEKKVNLVGSEEISQDSMEALQVTRLLSEVGGIKKITIRKYSVDYNGTDDITSVLFIDSATQNQYEITKTNRDIL